MNAFYGGIDFGTSSFTISTYQTHGPKGVLTGLGRRSFPSVVAISRTNELFISESAQPIYFHLLTFQFNVQSEL